MRKTTMNEPKTFLAENSPFLIVALIFFLFGISLIFGLGEIPLSIPFLVIATVSIAAMLVDIQVKHRSRKAASKQGLLIERILYDPTFFDPQHEFYFGDHISMGYRKRLVNSYSLQHRFRKTAIWALVMPDIGAKAEYPNGWKLVVKQNNVSDELRQTIDDIANDQLWKRNSVVLEIHSYPDKIYAIWNESNWKVADRLLDILSKMSEKTE